VPQPSQRSLRWARVREPGHRVGRRGDPDHNHLEKGDRSLGQEETYATVTGRWLPTARFPISAADRNATPYASWVVWADNN
jgi:hypothetical protein